MQSVRRWYTFCSTASPLVLRSSSFRSPNRLHTLWNVLFKQTKTKRLQHTRSYSQKKLLQNLQLPVSSLLRRKWAQCQTWWCKCSTAFSTASPTAQEDLLLTTTSILLTKKTTLTKCMNRLQSISCAQINLTLTTACTATFR